MLLARPYKGLESIGGITIDKETIEQVIRGQGLTVAFRSHISRRGDGNESTYVYVGKRQPGQRRGGMRSLGRIEKIMALSEAELQQRLTEQSER